MGNGRLFVLVGNELDDFVHNVKYLDNRVYVEYHLKMRPYGCKAMILAKNKETDQTFYNCLFKIRSTADVDALKLLLKGMEDSLDKFSKGLALQALHSD